MITVSFGAQIAPVAFAVKPVSIFGISFVVTGKKEIQATDRAITRHRCFSLTPEVGQVKFIGRILKIHIIDEESAIYAFMVDEIRVIKKGKKVD